MCQLFVWMFKCDEQVVCGEVNRGVVQITAGLAAAACYEADTSVTGGVSGVKTNETAHREGAWVQTPLTHVTVVQLVDMFVFVDQFLPHKENIRASIRRASELQ